MNKGGKFVASDVWNMLGIIIIGLLTAVILYPFLHEGGHSVVAFLVGADIVEFQILPVPYVMCNVMELTNVQQIFIGSGGMVFPLLVAIFVPRKWFWSWYLRFLLLAISLLAFMISALSLICPGGAIFNPQDDMVQVLSLWTGPKCGLVISLFVCAGLITAVTIMDKPLKMICRKFDI